MEILFLECIKERAYMSVANTQMISVPQTVRTVLKEIERRK